MPNQAASDKPIGHPIASEISDMSDDEIIKTVRAILRLRMEPHRAGKRAFAEGLTLRLEHAGVTEADLDRLGLCPYSEPSTEGAGVGDDSC